MSKTIERRAGSAGFTIVETIVVIGIMTILLLIVNQIFIINYDIVSKQTGRTDSEGGAVLATRFISELARGAVSVEATAVINGDAYTSSADALVLKLPSIDEANQVIAASYDYVAIARDPLDAERIVAYSSPAAGSARFTGTRLVTDYNDELIFRYNASDIAAADRVSVYLVNRKTVRGATTVARASTSLFLRNYAY